MSWQTQLLSLAAAALAYVVFTAVHRLYFSPLAAIPGPRWAALSLWNEFFYDVVRRGTFMWQIQDMHVKYGPCVRINPYEVHILDPDFYDELYVNTKRLDKYRWWTNLAGADGSSFSTITHDQHKLRRGALNPFFSARSVTRLEPLVQSKIAKLCARFDGFVESGEVLRLDAAFMALTMDVICDYAFSNDRKYLDEPDFKLLWKQTIIGAFEGGALGRQFPWMLPLMKRLPLSIVSAMNPSVGHLLNWQAGVKSQVRPILEGVDEITLSGDKDASSRTIFHTLRDSDLPPEERTLQRLCDEGEILTGAGSETTAQTLTRILFYLKQEPQTLAKLRDELDDALAAHPTTPSWTVLQQLPYLSAVVREGLRLSYGTTTRLPRIAHEDIRYNGHVIPAGTPYFVLMHPTIFPNPTCFWPERWLEAAAKDVKLDRYLVCFGKGSRQCLGLNLAYAEIYLTIAAVVRRFDWEMYETTLDDIVCKHDFFVAVASLDSKGLKVAATMGFVSPDKPSQVSALVCTPSATDMMATTAALSGQAVSVIGLGNMGTAIASCLMQAGAKVTVWNRTATKAEPLVARGAALAASPSACIDASPITVICVLSNATAKEALSDIHDLSQKTIVNLTNGSPQQARGMATLLQAQRGARYLHGAIMVPPMLLGKPTSATLCSGPRDVFDACTPVLSALGTPRHVGDDVGQASLLDNALLSLMGGIFEGWVQALAIVQRGGGGGSGDEVEFATGLASPFVKAMADWLPRIAAQVRDGEYAAGSPLRMQLEALDNIAATGEELGVGVLLGSLRDVMERAVREGKGEESIAGLVPLLTRQNDGT
ncbi:putative thiol methyltransferase 2 [Purpureocillium lavendulum]|uniref:Thiol methyltransferase 2 n=1 Tax=Purpureocillium lavendulum TaxID=1247861 RepID=A0AB34FNB4_9HYPO|nr:putative thiol methyltransferase 2 [Purpureocillium lavendulum]